MSVIGIGVASSIAMAGVWHLAASACASIAHHPRHRLSRYQIAPFAATVRCCAASLRLTTPALFIKITYHSLKSRRRSSYTRASISSSLMSTPRAAGAKQCDAPCAPVINHRAPRRSRAPLFRVLTRASPRAPRINVACLRRRNAQRALYLDAGASYGIIIATTYRAHAIAAARASISRIISIRRAPRAQRRKRRKLTMQLCC